MTSKMEILPDDGTATLFTVSETLGMHFWIDEDAVFMSAPSYATGGGCDMDISNLTAPTAAGTATAFYGTYFSGLIYTTYFSSAVGDGASPLPTAAGSAQYGFADAGAWVVINNKPNSSQVEFNFSTAGNMAESKAYTNEKRLTYR